MSFGYELSTRQTTRVLEQGLRRRAPVILEPRHEAVRSPLEGTLEQVLSSRMCVHVRGCPEATSALLPGLYCDGQLQIGEFRYLMTTHIVEATSCGDHVEVWLQRPETVMVVQRRRFRRADLADSVSVRLSWDAQTADFPVVGMLCNLSAEGLACRVPHRQVEDLMIGDRADITFALPRVAEPLCLSGILCNKTPAGSPEMLILGFQICEDEGTAASRERLRAYLQEAMSRRIPEGVEE